MEKSNIPNSEENIHTVNDNKILLLYHIPIQNLPKNIVYYNIDDIDNSNIHNFTHIIIQDLLDYYEDKTIAQILSGIREKMAPDSIIEIQGVDLKQLCVAVANDDVDEQLVKNILFSRKNAHNIYDIQNYLQDAGFQIRSKRFINIFEYNITATK